MPARAAAATVPTDVGVVVLISPRVMAQEKAWACDSLLHEMIHLALLAENDDGDEAHGDRFAAHANAIGNALGLPLVVPASPGSKEGPQSVRPSSYPRWKGNDCPLVCREYGDLVVYEDDYDPGQDHQAQDELVVYEEDTDENQG